jgi:hypothetical protein
VPLGTVKRESVRVCTRCVQQHALGAARSPRPQGPRDARRPGRARSQS